MNNEDNGFDLCKDSYSSFESSTTTSNSYRTKNKTVATDNYPDNIAVPTFQPYQFATSLFQSGNAYLQAGVNTKNLNFFKISFL